MADFVKVEMTTEMPKFFEYMKFIGNLKVSSKSKTFLLSKICNLIFFPITQTGVTAAFLCLLNKIMEKKNIYRVSHSE